jgi:hypothetical protein
MNLPNEPENHPRPTKLKTTLREKSATHRNHSDDDLQTRLHRNGNQTNRSLAAQTLRNWALDHKKTIPYEELQTLPLVSSKTAEHFIHFSPDERKAIKILKPEQFGSTIDPTTWDIRKSTLSEYLNRIALTQIVLGDDLKILGVTEAPDCFEETTWPCIVTSQSWRTAANPDQPNPTREQIEEFLQNLGFKALPRNYGWIREEDNIIIADARPDNFILTEEGVLPIDLLIAQKREE